MKPKWIISCLALILLSCSCRSLKQPKLTKETKTIVKETFRDSTVTIPADRSSFQAELKTDDTGNIQIKKVLKASEGKRAKAPKVQIKDQLLKVECLCDSLDIYLKLKDTHITDMLKETVFVPTEKPLSAWQQVQLWFGRVLLIGLAGIVIMLFIPRRTF